MSRPPRHLVTSPRPVPSPVRGQDLGPYLIWGGYTARGDTDDDSDDGDGDIGRVRDPGEMGVRMGRVEGVDGTRVTVMSNIGEVPDTYSVDVKRVCRSW